MTKNTKLLLGVAAVGAAGYFIWKSSQKKTDTEKKPFANAVGRSCQKGFEPTTVWVNYPNYPQVTSLGCYKKSTNSFYYV